MFSSLKSKYSAEDKLYNKILSLSRNKIFYTDFGLSDTFQNRVNLIFFHFSFINIKIKQNDFPNTYAPFFQNMFELIFSKIDQNMREIGYGDTAVNKKMKFLVTTYYNILLKCENYKKIGQNGKNSFFCYYLEQANKKNPHKAGR